MVDNTCITVTDVTVSVGKDDPKPTQKTVDIDFRLTKKAAGADNLWTISINPQLGDDGQPNTKKLHYTVSQADMSQILTVLNGIWQNQP